METKIGGFITEEHSAEITETFGDKVAEALNSEENTGKTFLQILVELGQI